MSGEKIAFATLSSIAGLDIRKAINRLKCNLLNEHMPFGFELYVRHAQEIKIARELVLIIPKLETGDKVEEDHEAVEGLMKDVCLPFLTAFSPSYDGRTELSAAVLVICDLVSACLERTTHSMKVRVLSLCLQSLSAFPHSTHSTDPAEEMLDIVCALELLRVTLDATSVLHNNQDDDLCDRIFTQSLAVLPELGEKMANRLTSSVIMKLVQQKSTNREGYLQTVWSAVSTDTEKTLNHGKKTTLTSGEVQRHLSLICSMANFYLPLSDGVSINPDIRCSRNFWLLVQYGLYDENPAVRKRGLYLLKRIIDTCEKSAVDFNVPAFSLAEKTVLPLFWWEKEQQSELSKVWEDFILLLETLDEKQTHVIKPILPRMQSLCLAATRKNGRSQLHTSWLVTLLMRAFHHESIFIVRWAAETVLYMDFASVPFMQQGQQMFLTRHLLVVLQDLKLYLRPEGSPVGSCSDVGSGLQQFFNSCCSALPTQQEKADFLQIVLNTLVASNWSSVPLVFICQGLSKMAPSPILNQQLLVSIREFVIECLTTLETFTRGAIECFLTRTVLNLLDKNAVSVEEFLDVLAVMERDESLQRGTQLWQETVTWLKNAGNSGDAQQCWTWAGLQKNLSTMVSSYLTVPAEMTGSALSETMRVTKIVRLLLLMADCGPDPAASDSSYETSKLSALSTTLSCAADVIANVNTRAYMPKLKADRAIYLIFMCAKEFGKNDGTPPLLKELCNVVESCWDELLVYVERRVLQNSEEDEGVDLDLVIFYADAIKTLGCLPSFFGTSALLSLAKSCVKYLPAANSGVEAANFSPLQQVGAVSLLASVAQIVDGLLRRKGSEKSGTDADMEQLSEYLWQVCSTISADCDVYAKNDRGASAQRGRRVCQYMESLWKCLHVLLSHHPSKRQAPPILDAALESFSVSSGETDIPIMQCVELVMPQLRQLVEEERIVMVCRVAFDRVQEEIKSWSYWLKMEAYINMVLQPALLSAQPDSVLGSYMTELLDQLFEVGGEKSGTLNLVMARLCDLWQGSEGTTLAQQMVTTIVDALMFGTVHKKAEKLWLEVCMYIETLGKDCSVNEILSCSQKNDMYVRLMTINYLSSLKPDNHAHVMLATSVLQEIWHRYIPLAQKSTFRQYTNSLHHRQKHRLLALLPLLAQFITEETCQESWKNAWQGLVLECHPSVRHYLEWLVLLLAHRFPQLLFQLWGYFDQFSSKRNVSLCSLLNMTSQLGPELRQDLQEQYYMQAIPLVVPWAMAHHFNTRLHGQACLLKLWEQCKQLNLTAVLEKHSIVQNCVKFHHDNSNACTVVLKLLDNYFYSCFHFLHDLSMETTFYTLPRLACISDDEWICPHLFSQWDKSWQRDSKTHSLPLHNSSRKLASCRPGPWRMKAQAENDEDVCESTDGNVQKKIIPWRLMTPDSHAEQEYSYRKKGSKPGGLVLVTSLINKLPNLGGLCRTSEIFGVSEFVIGNLSYLNDSTFQSLSVTAEKWIPITEVPEQRLSEFLEEKRKESYMLVGVEQTANSVSVTKFTFPKKTLLLLGNEKEGIPPDLLQLLDVCVEIPQQGIIRSLNVHVSGAILVWEYARQQMEQTANM